MSTQHSLFRIPQGDFWLPHLSMYGEANMIGCDMEVSQFIKAAQFIFPEPKTYIENVPWVHVESNKSDPSPLYEKWITEIVDKNDTKEKIKRVKKWIEEDTQTIRQPTTYKTISN